MTIFHNDVTETEFNERHDYEEYMTMTIFDEDVTETEFNECLRQEKKIEKNRSEALEFYFKYSIWGNPYHLAIYDITLILTFFDSDSEERAERADFRDKDFNKDLKAIMEICHDCISHSRQTNSLEKSSD